MSKTKKDFEEEVEETLKDAEEQANAEQDKETEDENIKVLDKLLAENQNLKDDYLRAVAEVENTKKRCQQEIEKNNKYAIANFAKNLLGVADNLQRAIDAASKDENNQSVTTYEYFVGKTYDITGLVGFYESISGNQTYQLMLVGTSDLVKL